MTMKSLLLGAAAGIAAVGAAQAADLPMTKGEAVEYVKVCTEFGPGFFYIPGSDTCLKIGGEIRADYRVFGGTGFSRDDNRSAFGTQGRIWFDARTQTDWGLLRSYFQINASGRTASVTGLGTQNKFEVDKAFIQFGGLTAGYAHSFFGFYDNDYGNTIWAPYYAESSTVNLLAYTAQFGGGFQATLSIEDGRDHRSSSQFGDIVIAGTRYNYRQGGQQFPDIVGQLRLDQSWGGLAVQAALHQNRSGENYLVDTNGDGILDTTVNNPHKSKVGWAVGATALIKIPVIEEGHFIVEGQYANGATHYLGSGKTISGTADYYLAPVGTTGVQGKAGKGWSIVAELGGNITPVLNANLVGSYIDTKYDNSYGAGAPDFGIKEYTIAGNLTYTIVKGLTVGLEVAYTREQRDNLQVVGGTAEAPTVSYVDDKRNVWQAGVRLKRKF